MIDSTTNIGAPRCGRWSCERTRGGFRALLYPPRSAHSGEVRCVFFLTDWRLSLNSKSLLTPCDPSNNLTLSLAPGWAFVETEGWRPDALGRSLPLF
ncbi:uncharacterized protein F5147DRAFT_585804 [Suillus discolor]|uniref:Uncharacterized protein n=1 Tax=Suillus discolor TaxID=1912936 RepID=A0A9P7EV01_9AGAM|nr:uncharacterized protein F5147DRAFT_585804 [Suillus discolor]KAG2092645.1 hypothetical protein F5147DRAFT_585804 [Suillus discolor]